MLNLMIKILIMYQRIWLINMERDMEAERGTDQKLKILRRLRKISIAAIYRNRVHCRRIPSMIIAPCRWW